MCDSATEDKKTSVVCQVVGVQLGMRFSGQKSRRFLAGGDDDGARGCRSPG